MKAVWYEAFGPAREVLQTGEISRPEAAEGEVLVRLETSGVNPSDVKKRAGSAPELLDDGPVIPHSDGAGVIEAVGADVSRQRIGERVWVYQAQHRRRFGTAVEYVALPGNRAVPLPDNVSYEIGACIGIPIMTAHRCVFADGPVAGHSVLVTGGAGRVGHYAIQWAAGAGAQVFASVGSLDDAEVCRQAGASAVVSYRDEDWPAQIIEANDAKPVDRVIEVEFGANLPRSLDVVRTSGTIVTYGSAAVPEPALPFYRLLYRDVLLRFVIVYDMPEAAKQAAIAEISDKLARESLQHRIRHVLSLQQTAQAHELIEQGGFHGCVVVRTRDRRS